MIRTVLPAAIAGVLAALIVNVVTVYAPDWEGRIWPVTVLHSLSYKDPVPTVLLVEGEATKVRDCELLSTAVYAIGDDHDRTLANITPVGPIRLRPLGQRFFWGPWSIEIPVYKVKATVKAVTTHRCHPLWVTRTEFWSFDISY
jgi:hypothetical protein